MTSIIDNALETPGACIHLMDEMDLPFLFYISLDSVHQEIALFAYPGTKPYTTMLHRLLQCDALPGTANHHRTSRSSFSQKILHRLNCLVNKFGRHRTGHSVAAKLYNFWNDSADSIFLSFHIHGDLFRRYGERSKSMTGCMEQSVCNSRKRRIDHNLTDGFCSERSAFFIAAFKFHTYFANVQPGGNLILHQGIFKKLALAVIGDVFCKYHANPLQNSAFCLHSGKVGVDWCSTVHGCVVMNHRSFSRFNIRFQFCRANHKRRRRGRGEA